MRRVLYITVVILAVCLVAFPAVADEAMDDLESAYRAQREGDYETAIDFYSRLLKGRSLSTGQRAVVYLLRGESYKDKGECDRAIHDFDRAMKLKFDYAQAHFFRGVCLETEGRLEEAAEDLAKAVEINPDRELYQATLARVRVALEKQAKAKSETKDKPMEEKPGNDGEKPISSEPEPGSP